MIGNNDIDAKHLYDAELEKRVLGGLIIAPRAAVDQAMDSLTDQAFTPGRAQDLYRAIAEHHLEQADGVPLDGVKISELVTANVDDADIGQARDFIMECAGALPNSSMPRASSGEHLPGHVARLMDLAGKRQTISDLEKLQNDIVAGKCDDLHGAAADLAEAARARANGDGRKWGLQVLNADEVQTRPIRWLWPTRFALAKLAILCGDPELFKTGLLMDMAARISAGTPWPDRRDEHNPAGDMVIMSSEDAADDVLVPRLKVANADLGRIKIVESVRRPGGAGDVHFSLADDLHHLDRLLSQLDARLICIDPLDGYLPAGKIDSHKQADVRRVLAPLQKLAERHDCAIVCIKHFVKNREGRPTARISGSVAFGAAGRTVWTVCPDPQDEHEKLMLCAKMNFAAKPTGLRFKIGVNYEVDQPYVKWSDEAVTMTANEALGGTGGGVQTAFAKAIEWVKDRLSNGPMLSADFFTEASDAGISDRTLTRARHEVGVRRFKRAGEKHGPWMVEIPSMSKVGVVGDVGCLVHVGQLGQDRQDGQHSQVCQEVADE